MRLKAQLIRELDRLEVVLEQLKTVAAERGALLEPARNEAASPAAMLVRLKGIGPATAVVLWSEGLFRQFDNRRQVAAYAGLAPTPWQNGSIDHEQGVSKAGNPRLPHVRVASPSTRLRRPRRARTYVSVDLSIWELPLAGRADALAPLARKLLAELDRRRRLIEKNERFLGDQSSEIWAWHWNNAGLINQVLAVCALRSGRGAPTSDLTNEAEKAYGLALQADPGFGSAKFNLGRLHLEVTQDLNKAADILTKTLIGAEDAEYTHYNLGILRTLQGDRKAAIEQFKKAPTILGLRGRQASWIGARKMLVHELRKWGRRDEALQLLNALAKEHPTDQDVQRQLLEPEDLAS
jgi:Transposase IS116/IS110/IS902 family